MKQARILIRGRTIFFLPYFEYPISSERRSGFLPPEFTYTSRSGYQFGVPIYLVLSSWSDLTIYPYWLEQSLLTTARKSKLDGPGKFPENLPGNLAGSGQT